MDKEQDPAQVQPRYAMELKTGTKPKSRLEDTDIVEFFDKREIHGKLLILGKPGSGKTTLLVKLAQELVCRAKEDSQHPIPVLLNLSSWKEDKQSIQDWLIEELKLKYGVHRDLGQKWVTEQEIIPLLDGLDELAGPRQLKCVEKINQFLFGWANPLVVCSRSEEYSLYPELLGLNNSLELQPFTEEQVWQYLQTTGNSELSEVIRGDAELQQLATTPLFLTIIVLSAEEIYWDRWQEFSSAEERLEYLFAAYIRRMLCRPYRGKKPEEELTMYWLSWLAQRLIEENQTEFLIERVQPYWIKKERQKLFYRLISGLTLGLIGGLIVWPILGLKFGLMVWLIYGLILELIFGLMEGLAFPEIESKNYPNQGIWNSLKNVATISFIIAPLVALMTVIIFWWIKQNGEAITVLPLVWTRLLMMVPIVAFGLGAITNGIPLVQHMSLRLVLWANGYAPWNYARFLDYATDRSLMQRVGGRYRFIHDLLRQHLAKNP
ncbi:MAG: NACHT domain-containing protein [Symploca sp. SIO2E6]|nr:NACHT domain-containing protein [Symploca sp. SIO2E6]